MFDFDKEIKKVLILGDFTFFLGCLHLIIEIVCNINNIMNYNISFGIVGILLLIMSVLFQLMGVILKELKSIKYETG